jgi:hypothetical protein
VVDEFTAGVYVHHRYSAFDEHLGQEFRAVTIFRATLAAEERERVAFPVCGYDAFDPRIESSAFAAAVVVNVTLLVVTGRIVWAAAEGIAEEDIPDPVISKCPVKSIAREFGPPAGVRHGSDIPDKPHVVAMQQLEELVDGPEPVAERDDRLLL